MARMEEREHGPEYSTTIENAVTWRELPRLPLVGSEDLVDK